MRAIVRERYGPPGVLELDDVAKPEVGPRGILIRIRATSLNRSDWETLIGRPAYVRIGGNGIRTPKLRILGSDVAGVVEAVGGDVTRFRPGDRVMGDSLYYGHGGLAEYVALTERVPLIAMPEGLSFELAAALPQAAILALQGLSRVRPTAPGDRVLVNGAGGGGGTFAIQMAKHLGAEVTAVDHAWKQEMMRSIGADHVIDHLIDNYPKRGPFDRILDFVGSRSLRANRKALARDGVYSLVGGPVRRLLGASTLGWIGSKAGSKHLGVLIAKPNREDLGAITRLVVEGTVTPVIHRTYALQEVPEALAELGANRVLGKAVIVP